MFIREKNNASGSTSIQIISKHRGTYKVVKTVGCGATRQQIEALKHQACQEIAKIER
jgi:hypothetical protein